MKDFLEECGLGEAVTKLNTLLPKDFYVVVPLLRFFTPSHMW